MKNSSGSFFIPMRLLLCRQHPGRSEGQDASVAGWRGFTRAVVIHEWKETHQNVQLFNGGKSAMVTHPLSITVARGTGKQTMQGRDMVFLAKEGRSGSLLLTCFHHNPPDRICRIVTKPDNSCRIKIV